MVAALQLRPSMGSGARTVRGPTVLESLIENLRCRQRRCPPQARQRDIRMSDRNVQRQALPAMIDLLTKEKDGQVRLAVLDALTALGPDAAVGGPRARCKRCGPISAARGAKRRTRTIVPPWRLAAIGKPAVEGLRGLLKRAQGKRASRSRHGPGSNRAGRRSGRPRPDRAARRQERTVRREAAGGTRAHRHGRGRAARRRIPRTTIRSFAPRAVDGLAHLPDPSDEAKQAVFKCAQDTSPAVRAAAMKSLAGSGCLTPT